MRRTRLILPAAGLLLSGAAALAAAGTAGPQASSPNAGAGSAVVAPSSKPRGGAAATTGSTFATEGEAAKACGGANVVWGNASTKVFHVQEDRYYGHTKHGAFMCRSTATAEGFHQSGQTARKG